MKLIRPSEEHMHFATEQKIVTIGNVTLGGQPGEHPTTIWAGRSRGRLDPTPGEYAAAASDAMFGPAWLVQAVTR